MKPISTITVASELPDALAPLRDLALNLRWSWRRQTVDLFRSLDPQVFVDSGENPFAMLSKVPAGRLAEAARDESFLARMRSEVGDLRTYLDSGRWFQRTVPGEQGTGQGSSIAYFSMEFGITPTLPIYSGGLGILAGDHLKSASDLGVPLTAIGLLYQWGYFSQSLDRSGWQQEEYRLNDPADLPVEPVLEQDGTQLTVRVTLPGGRDVAIAVWKAQVGRVALLLLDTNVEGNDEAARQITDRLYGGDHEHRIVQEIVLGIGGVRATRSENFSVRQDIQQNPNKLALAQLNLSAATGEPALSAGDGRGGLALSDIGKRTVGFAAAGGSAAGSKTLSAYAADFAGDIGSRASAAESRSKSASAVLDEANNRRQAKEGVNMDEELVNMTTYQQAYNASARLIQAASDMYDTLLGML